VRVGVEVALPLVTTAHQERWVVGIVTV
jgi:hypothetical protein